LFAGTTKERSIHDQKTPIICAYCLYEYRLAVS
jgi:hypothetical protein